MLFEYIYVDERTVGQAAELSAKWTTRQYCSQLSVAEQTAIDTVLPI